MLSEASRKLNPTFSIRKEDGRYVLSGVDVMTDEIRNATYSDAPDRFRRVFEYPEGHLKTIPYRNPDGTTNKVVAVVCARPPDGTVIEETLEDHMARDPEQRGSTEVKGVEVWQKMPEKP